MEKAVRGDPYQHGITKLPSYFVYLKFFIWGIWTETWHNGYFDFEKEKVVREDPYQHGVTKLPSNFVYLTIFLNGASKQKKRN